MLRLQREPSDERTGVFTTGIVSTGERKIALYFTGRQHAGENLADVLKRRAAELPPPIQMCDALSRNVPKLAEGALAALLIARLPSAHPGEARAKPATEARGRAPEAHAGQVYAAQFAFVFATVLTFPYFIPFTQAGSKPASLAVAGLLFGIPHLVYLLCAVPLSRYLGQGRLLATLSSSFLLLAGALAAQALFPTLPGLTAGRIAMGLGMTLGFISLHALIAAVVTRENAGRTFGWFESNAKWGAVGAGLIAGTAVQALDLRAPFFIGAFTMLAAGAYLAGVAFHRLQLRNS